MPGMNLDPVDTIRDSPAALPWSRNVHYFRWGAAWVYLGRAVGSRSFVSARRSSASGWPERWVTVCLRGRYLSVGGDF